MSTSITLDDENAEKLKEICEKNNRSMSGQVRHWISNPLNHMSNSTLAVHILDGIWDLHYNEEIETSDGEMKKIQERVINWLDMDNTVDGEKNV